MSIRFKKHTKKRGFLGACCDRIRKYKKHHGGRGNANEMKQHKIHFDKYHFGYLEKVRTRYLRKCRKLCERERAGTSSIQNDIVEEVILEDEEEDFVVFDDYPFTKIIDREKGSNEDQLFDKSPDINEIVEIYSDEITNTQLQLYATSMTLNYDDDAYAKSSCKPCGAVRNGIAPQVE
nr:60S ribosomal protein L27a-2-like [Nicotiana tomentosiformis]